MFPAELKHALYNMGMELCEEEIEDMMHEADTDGDGQISFTGKSTKQQHVILHPLLYWRDVFEDKVKLLAGYDLFEIHGHSSLSSFS